MRSGIHEIFALKVALFSAEWRPPAPLGVWWTFAFETVDRNLALRNAGAVLCAHLTGGAPSLSVPIKPGVGANHCKGDASFAPVHAGSVFTDFLPFQSTEQFMP